MRKTNCPDYEKQCPCRPSRVSFAGNVISIREVKIPDQKLGGQSWKGAYFQENIALSLALVLARKLGEHYKCSCFFSLHS